MFSIMVKRQGISGNRSKSVCMGGQVNVQDKEEEITAWADINVEGV